MEAPIQRISGTTYRIRPDQHQWYKWRTGIRPWTGQKPWGLLLLGEIRLPKSEDKDKETQCYIWQCRTKSSQGRRQRMENLLLKYFKEDNPAILWLKYIKHISDNKRVISACQNKSVSINGCTLLLLPLEIQGKYACFLWNYKVLKNNKIFWKICLQMDKWWYNDNN